MSDLVIVSARWDITSRCNLQCIHCYADRDSHSDLSYSAVRIIIDRLHSSGVKEINYSGKEPTMRKDILDIVKYSCTKGISVNMTTNGVNTNSAIYTSLIESGLDMLFFSLDGAAAAIHDRIRGSGNFCRTRSNIELCINYTAKKRMKTKIGISTTMQKLNYRSIHRILDLCQSLGIHMLVINPVSLCGSALSVKKRLYLEPDKIAKSWDRICSKYSNMNPSFNMYLGTFPMEAKLLNLRYSLDLPVVQTGCSAGKTVYIDHQGHVLPCYMLPLVVREVSAFRKYVKHWNIINEPMTKAAMYFKPFIDYATNYTQRGNLGCHDCSDFQVCRRCPLIAISDKEAITRCQIAKSQLALLRMNIVPDLKMRLKRDMAWDIRKGKLVVTTSQQDYRNEKEYELDHLGFEIWKRLVNEFTLQEVVQEITKVYSSSNVVNMDHLGEVVQYFWKENVLEPAK